MDMARRRPGLALVIGLWSTGMVVQLAPLVFGSGPSIGSMTALFWLVCVAASLCVITSGALLGLALRRSVPELGVVAGFFLVGSLLPLVHGITTPGVLYTDNNATMLSVFITIPMASLVALPSLFGRTTIGRRILGAWRPWVCGWILAALVLSVVLLVAPNALPAPAPRSALSVATALLMIVVTAAFAGRHLRLAFISQDVMHATVAVGFAWFGVSAAVWFDGAPLSIGFWTAHLFDIFGVLAATVGGYLAHRSGGSVDDVLRPITRTDPLSALEAGLDPIVHRFVASLEAKDPITRDHVIRTAALAVEVADELRLPAREMRRTGLAALLHDVGKLEIPDEILNKNGRLDEHEFAVIKGHPTIGADMARTSPVLAEIAPLIEAHHERIDGGGYPMGLEGDAIPFPACIISVCDAFDAIANTRQYRQGAGAQRSLDVLAEHAGTQWHPDAVAAATRVIKVNQGAPDAAILHRVGRDVDGHDAQACGCVDALPEQVAAELART